MKKVLFCVEPCVRGIMLQKNRAIVDRIALTRNSLPHLARKPAERYDLSSRLASQSVPVRANVRTSSRSMRSCLASSRLYGRV
jgi:hypothetical protein